MAVTAATPIALAQSLLNDTLGVSYTSAVLIPFLQKAYRELQIKMSKAGLGQTKEVSASITVAAGTTRLADGAQLPNNLLYPIKLWERGSTSERWVPIDERRWEPNTEQGATLGVYAWREEEIHFVGALTDRLVQIDYAKGLTAITSTSTALEINDSDLFLASRCAAIAALVVGENPSRAAALDVDAEKAWMDLKGDRVKGRQGMPVRRRVNRFRQ